tara:strand:+ start:53 stop:814 length:762 start_codon:yes stop_codon:yes gene_type:complete
MIIKIDNREKDLIMYCNSLLENYKSIRIEVCVLPLGDAIICNDSNTERVIIERKSLRDLAASIRDGRYNEQSYRLDQCSIHNHNIYYLIEGEIDKYVPGRININADALRSAIVSLSFYKGFSIHHASSLKESALWLMHFADKLSKKKDLGHFEDKDEVVETNNQVYSQVIKRSKKDCITMENIGEIMLSQIPSVSAASAIQIMQRYDNICTLIEALKTNKTALNDIILETKGGKQRRISKTAIANVYKYLQID